jgi:hypothetical protein
LPSSVKRDAQRHVGVLRRDRADPDFEQLRLAAQVRAREELEHPAREGFDVGVVAVVHAAQFADALVQVGVRGAVLAQPGLGQPQGREVRVRTRLTAIGRPKEIAVARVFFSMISTSRPCGLRPCGAAIARQAGAGGQAARRVFSGPSSRR